MGPRQPTPLNQLPVWLFGVASVVVGLGYVLGFVFNSMALLATAAGGTILLVGTGIILDFHRNGIGTTENWVYAVGAIAGTLVLLTLVTWTDLPNAFAYAVTVLVGVVLPRLVSHRITPNLTP